MITWIIGAGGLLGQHLSTVAGPLFRSQPVPWCEPELAKSTLQADVKEFMVAASDHPWRVLWVAGAATTSSGARTTETELRTLEGLLEALRASPPSGPGVFFLASSAGGLYAGSQGSPFSSSTPPHPLSPYGELKLAQEKLALTILGDHIPVLCGRLSNLYGPGQDLAKPQGLISRLALSAASHQATNIYVSLDTTRDYLYAGDAAELITGATADPRFQKESGSIVIGSGSAVTVGQLISTMERVAKRRIPVAFGADLASNFQAHDLRLRPDLTPDDPLPLAAGMKLVYLDIVNRLQQSTSVVLQ